MENAHDRGSQSTSHDLPPWTVREFNVLKKPPPVPKPRCNHAVKLAANDPSDDISLEATTNRTPASASVERPKLRWGQLDNAPSVGIEPVPPPFPALEEASVGKSAPGKTRQLPPDYHESWQKWRAMPRCLMEMRQELQRPVQAPMSAGPPSAEAAAFLELLLSGTEPVAGVERESVAVGLHSPSGFGTAQVVNAARRLEVQAVAARQRHRVVGCKPVVGVGAQPASATPATGSTTAAPPTGGLSDSVSPPIGNQTEYESRMLERQRAHAKRLQELEAGAKQEQEDLMRQLEKEMAELSERRRAQDEWQQRWQRDFAEKRHRVDRETEARTKSGFVGDAASRGRWWKDKTRQKEYEHNQRFQEHGSDCSGFGNVDKKQIPAPPPLPPAVASRTTRPDEQKVVQQLRSKRLESLEDRKSEWRTLCLQWHPDKCQDKDASTAMFQFLQGLKVWFLAEV